MGIASVRQERQDDAVSDAYLHEVVFEDERRRLVIRDALVSLRKIISERSWQLEKMDIESAVPDRIRRIQKAIVTPVRDQR